MTDATRETPAPGVVVYQPARGFRYSADAFWLAGLALSEPAASALDLGTGSGVVAFLLARAGVETLGVDLREEWRPMWSRSLAESETPPSLRVADVGVLEVAPVDLITCNPPYFPAGSGPVAPDPLKAAARTESTATLDAFVACAARHLRPGGRACFVVPREREAEVAGSGLHAREIWRIGRRRSLVVLRAEAGPCDVVAHDEQADEVTSLYALARGT